MAALPAELPASTLSLAQQRELLWADPRSRVYALLLGSRMPGLRERLDKEDVDDWDGLWTGELDADERAAAPALVTLKRASPFTEWLLAEAASVYSGWGALAVSKLPFLAMRSHGRALCRATLPNGQSIRIDWMDPEVLEALLPVAGADTLQRVYAGFDGLVTLEPARWTRWSVEGARLQRHVSGVM